MRLSFKGRIIVNGRTHEFRITLTAPIEACDYIRKAIERKLQEKGWTPNVP